MNKELSVYKQLTFGTKECLTAVRREIGMKTECIPFAIKLIEAMKSLSLKTTQEELDAANEVLSGLQTLMQGGIKAEDYDKIDFVKRGKKLSHSQELKRSIARRRAKVIALPTL